VVSLPRNHLDLLCQPGGRKTAGLLICARVAQLEDTGELALDLDPEFTLVRNEADFRGSLVGQKPNNGDQGRPDRGLRCDGTSRISIVIAIRFD
jgi:hypothetical protein